MDCLGKNTTKVHNIKSNLLASLLNAGSTILKYYKAEVYHEYLQFADDNIEEMQNFKSKNFEETHIFHEKILKKCEEGIILRIN